MISIRTDCRRYRVNAPCQPHKERQVRCEDCDEYSPVDARILIVKLDAMGDVLRTTSCLEPLRELYPRGHITWITRNRSKPLLERNPSIDRILTVESNYLEIVLAEEFDLALNPDADSLSASILALVSASEKRGFTSDRRGGVMPLNAAAEGWWAMGLDDRLKRENRRTYGEWLYAICELPGPVARPSLQPSASALDDVTRFLSHRAPGYSRVACFNTGAGARWQEKRWKAEHYRDLARHIHDCQPSTAIVLVGGPDESAINASLVEAHAPFIDGGTNNSVDMFAALIASSDWLLTPDSLGYHVACAVGTPALCVAGPTSPWELDVYDINQVLHADIDCIACYLARCPLATTCMDLLTPDAVWQRLTQTIA